MTSGGKCDTCRARPVSIQGVKMQMDKLDRIWRFTTISCTGHSERQVDQVPQIKWKQQIATMQNDSIFARSAISQCGSGRDHVCRTNSAEKRPWLKALFRECAAHSKSGPLARHEFTMESNTKVQIGQYESLILNRTPLAPLSHCTPQLLRPSKDPQGGLQTV